MPKSITIKKNGGPEVLEIQDVEVGSPGPDQIKVTNHAIGLNYIDTYHRSGLYSLKLPSGIGLEAAGKIEEVKPSSLKEQLGIFSNKVDNFGGDQQRKNPTKKIRNKRKNADHSRNKSRN